MPYFTSTINITTFLTILNITQQCILEAWPASTKNTIKSLMKISFSFQKLFPISIFNLQTNTI